MSRGLASTRSRRRSAVAVSFEGVAAAVWLWLGHRDQAAKVFISHEHGKVTGNLDRGMPGPGRYKVGAMTGAKVVSSGYGKSSAAWGMGTSKRFADAFAKARRLGPVLCDLRRGATILIGDGRGFRYRTVWSLLAPPCLHCGGRVM